MRGSGDTPNLALLDELALLPPEELDALLAELSAQEAAGLLGSWEATRRPAQAPRWDDPWSIWLYIAARRTGKNKSVVRAISEGVVEEERFGSIGIGVRRYRDIEEVMIGPPSGFATLPSKLRPKVRMGGAPRVEWSNGAKAYFYSAESPEARGPGHDLVWSDEAGFYTRKDAVGANLRDNLVLTASEADDRPREIITSTPTNLPFLRKLIQRAKAGDPEIQFSHERMEDNRANLPVGFIEQRKVELLGTPRYRTEIEGELPEAVEGAYWTPEMMEWAHNAWPVAADGMPEAAHALAARCDELALGIDPAGTSEATSDETGFAVCGRYRNEAGDRRYATFAIEGGRMGPGEWMARMRYLAQEWGLTRVYVETNQMREVVERAMRAEVGDTLAIETFHSSRSKQERAHPIVNAYARKLVAHAPEVELESEDQLTAFPTLAHLNGDDRVDALVFAMTPLISGAGPGVWFAGGD